MDEFWTLTLQMPLNIVIAVFWVVAYLTLMYLKSMTILRSFFPLSLGVVLLSLSITCTNEEKTDSTSPPSSTSTTRIMPLGASRVAGATPQYESYRYELWKLLIDDGFEFDFIGTEKDEASYPDYNGSRFDPDHQGFGGITSGGILGEIEDWLGDLDGVPDIVLFSSPGGNDGVGTYQQTVSNVNTIIDILQDTNPNVTIYLELPAPPVSRDQTPEFMAYYNQALQSIRTIADEQTTSSSNVFTIDMMTGFSDAFLADEVHYNASGARFIARRYYEQLAPILE